jgi:hypothetical protein
VSENRTSSKEEIDPELAKEFAQLTSEQLATAARKEVQSRDPGLKTNAKQVRDRANLPNEAVGIYDLLMDLRNRIRQGEHLQDEDR